MTPNTTDVLLATAQIAVAFAGFSGLAGLLGRRHTMDDVRIDVMRLRAVIEGSLSVCGGCLLPLLLEAAAVPGRPAWRLASGAYLAASLTLVTIWTRRIRCAIAEGAPLDRRIIAMFYAIAGVMTVLLGLNLAGSAGSGTIAVYLAALDVELLGMAVLFLRFVASMVTIDGPGRSPPSPAR